MSKYTAEQVEQMAERLDIVNIVSTEHKSSEMLRDYAVLLREREAAKAEPVGYARTDGCMHFAYLPESVKDGDPVYEAAMLASAWVPDGWQLGDVDLAQGADMWTAGIDIPVDRRYSGDGIHSSAIECHAPTKEMAEALRAQVMLAAAPKRGEG